MVQEEFNCRGEKKGWVLTKKSDSVYASSFMSMRNSGVCFEHKYLQYGNVEKGEEERRIIDGIKGNDYDVMYLVWNDCRVYGTVVRNPDKQDVTTKSARLMELVTRSLDNLMYYFERNLITVLNMVSIC